MTDNPIIVSRTLVPATGDLVSLADVKLELQITDVAQDAWLQATIGRVSTAVANFCNRTFQPQLYHDQILIRSDARPWQYRGAPEPLQLHNWPVLSQLSPAGAPPPPAPVVVFTPGGSGAATSLYLRATYVTPDGESAPSLEARIVALVAGAVAIVSPPLDLRGLALGWNLYAGTAPAAERLQNPSPLPIGAGATLAVGAIMTATPAPPDYMTVVENAAPPGFGGQGAFLPPDVATPLIAGVDFMLDSSLGQIERLSNGRSVRAWPDQPIVVEYRAGFDPIPADLYEAVIRLVKMRWFARSRDPLIRSENVVGVYEAQYFFGTGPGGPADMPNDIAALLDREYRVPVIA